MPISQKTENGPWRSIGTLFLGLIGTAVALLSMIGIYAFGYSVYYGERSREIEPIRTAGITVRNIYEQAIGGDLIETLSKDEKRIDLHALMLHLTNEARAEAGVPPVQMGTNPAAQMHAEAALAGCYSAHWDEWGLKSYHRYTLMGGQGASGENVLGSNYCIKPGENYAYIGPMHLEVKKAVQGWMESPGHQRTILDPNHTVLNTGIAHDKFNTVMVQLFDTDYVEYTIKPNIAPTETLEMSGTVHGATLDTENLVPVQVLYDPPLMPLNRGQLAGTYSLCQPRKIGYVVKPLTGGRFYPDPQVRYDIQTYQCVNPYEVPKDTPSTSGQRRGTRSVEASQSGQQYTTQNQDRDLENHRRPTGHGRRQLSRHRRPLTPSKSTWTRDIHNNPVGPTFSHRQTRTALRPVSFLGFRYPGRKPIQTPAVPITKTPIAIRCLRTPSQAQHFTRLDEKATTRTAPRPASPKTTTWPYEPKPQSCSSPTWCSSSPSCPSWRSSASAHTRWSSPTTGHSCPQPSNHSLSAHTLTSPCPQINNPLSGPPPSHAKTFRPSGPTWPRRRRP